MRVMLFIEFRDPLFGIIVFFLLIFIITLVSYWYQQLKRREEDKSLQNFLKKFDNNLVEDDLRQAIESTLLADKSWFLVAKSYLIRGEYEKSIEIYKTLLERQSSPQLRRDTMFLLGKSYFKAGFLERSRDIFLEILKQFPRSTQVLDYMLLTYEKLHRYQDAIDVVEPMKMQNMATQLIEDYLQVLMIIHCSNTSVEKKVENLLNIYQTSFHSKHIIFEYLFKYDTALAWSNLDVSQCDKIVDILWKLPAESCNFDIISQHAFLRELYTAKGYINEAKSSNIFEFNVLIHLDKSVEASLKFEYLCTHCKEVSPFIFHRCPRCHSIDSSIVEYTLIHDVFESQYSF